MKIFSRKKGDLSLSVNAIVVLVIAIIFLGLAIGFTTKLLGKSKDKLEAGLDIDISQPANSENPIIIDGKLSVKAGDKTPIKISYYNTQSTQNTNAKPILQGCTVDGTATVSTISLIAVGVNVPSYKETRYQTQLSATGAAATGEYICNLQIVNSATPTTIYYQKQMSVSVTS